MGIKTSGQTDFSFFRIEAWFIVKMEATLSSETLIFTYKTTPRKTSEDINLNLDIRFPAEVDIFLFVTAFRPALGLTEPPIQTVPGALPPEVKRPEVTLTTHHI
jgi:hypothetical protein